MQGQPLYISKEGLEKVKAELHHMKTVVRKELADRIERAKELGDLRENADYQQGKEDLSFTEGKINELSDMITRAVIVEPSSGGNMVQIGATVVVETSEGKQKTYSIVGATEADPLAGRISNESPLGQAMIGKGVGQEFEFKAPAGVITYTVKEIK